MNSLSFLWHLLQQERLSTSPAMSHRTANTIALLIRAFRKQYRKKSLRIVEIGTAHWFSALSLAQSLQPDDTIWSLEYCYENTVIASYHHRVLSAIWAQESFAAPTIHFLHCDGAIFPKKELGLRNRIDVLIIDAQKTSYETYIQTYSPFMAKTCLIIADDVLLFRHKIPQAFFDFFETKKTTDHLKDEIWSHTTFQTDPDDGIFVALRRRDTAEYDILDDSFLPLYGCHTASSL